ncbi:MAG: nucleotide triphosphate diphosphatase NUDT15 [Endozoicomonas sp.]|uniref:nucleotide triphosphate diphosphatase NUDT15 n=1 Tax=Endozoicomonas sp. TaxID=1892382 RepID=UPI003D9AB6A8
MTDQKLPRIGVGVIVKRDNKILLGRRINSHGEGQWAFPGGHLEFGESPEECAARELMEETGLTLDQIRTGPYTNDVFTTEGKHYITLFMIAESSTGTPEVKEPEKCLEWEWFEWNSLPAPLFLPIIHLKATGYQPDSQASRPS